MAGFCPFTRSDIGFSSVRTPQTFLTLSLQDMASRVQLSGPQEAEKYVLHMVSSPERPKHKNTIQLMLIEITISNFMCL